MDVNNKAESEIFHELSLLCASPGYIHAIGCFCLNNNIVQFADQLCIDDILKQYSDKHLVRTEISTLIALANKNIPVLSRPSLEVLQYYIQTTEKLLEELHYSMVGPGEKEFDFELSGDPSYNPLSSGVFLREPIIYSGEAAYLFQYLDLSEMKYERDSDWLLENKGYTTSQLISTIKSLLEVQNKKIYEFYAKYFEKKDYNFSYIEAYKFTAMDISEMSGIELDITENVLKSFVFENDMSAFTHISDFNPINAFPILSYVKNEYIMFQHYGIAEALYESPFFWFNDDKKYKQVTIKNRGAFVENYSYKRLSDVFGAENVHKNVIIYNKRGDTIGEIDVLVLFVNRAIVLQAKSKKLTIESRKGNDKQLKDDFKMAIQDSYDQAFKCAEFLNKDGLKFIDGDGAVLRIEQPFAEIYPICIVSENYPALSFQTIQFLRFTTTYNILAPFVMDVFFLDVVSEFLDRPLLFLSFMKRRARYNITIQSSHELTILSYHLQHNLWFDGEYSFLLLAENICADLDLSMIVRRKGVCGKRTPEGILTKYSGTVFAGILSQIENNIEPGTIEIGFALLEINEKTIRQINTGIEYLAKLSIADKKCHDITFGTNESGITFHISNNSIEVESKCLQKHITRRKYVQKANKWIGIVIDPNTKSLKFGVYLKYDWEYNKELDELTRNTESFLTRQRLGQVLKNGKIGRNDSCPCGSGVKFKKCCGY